MHEVPTREEFLFLPTWQIVGFYCLMAVSVVVLGIQVAMRVRVWMQGERVAWSPDYFGGIAKYVLAQRKVKSSRPKSGAPMHLLIFYGFLTLFLATTLLAINTYSPWKFHKGTYYLTYEWIADVMGLGFVIGVVWALVRRLFWRPRALTQAPPDYWTLVLLLALGVSGFVLEALRMSANPHSFDVSAPIGYAISRRLGTVSAQTYVAFWWFHVFLVAGFLMVIPRLRLRHILFAIFSAAGADPNAKMGALTPLSIEDVERTGRIGANAKNDYSRWHLMSLDACMECGRCTEVCPAHLAGKLLNPKKVVQDVRGIADSGTSIASAVSEEALWACTTCNACVEACPVLIRHVDMIVDARRSLVSENRLTGTAATMLRQLQSTESSWGTPSAEREKWMEGCDIPLARDLAAKGEPFEILVWVGCAGAIDPNAMKTTRALSALLKKAGVKFACLGIEERCTGDSARRLGDEFLFQQMAQQNIETFEKYGVRKIVTACPHCFNTLKNEYPQFRGEYEVMHHTQFFAQLIETGKLHAPKPREGELTIHDPCYLARVNGEVDAQRNALGSASSENRFETPMGKWLNEPMENRVRIIEPEHRGVKTLCCGAGGGRMWMEEPAEQRPSTNRWNELKQTGAETVAVACPFCRIMLDAGKDAENTMRLKDVAEIVYEANCD